MTTMPAALATGLKQIRCDEIPVLRDGRRVTEHMLIVDSELSISSFGEDRLGELLVVSLDGGIYRLAVPE